MPGARSRKPGPLAVNHLASSHPVITTLASNLATLRQNQGDLEGAEELLKVVHEVRSRQLGPSHEKTLIPLCGMAAVALKRNAAPSAKELYRDGLSRCLEHLGEDHPQTYRFRLGLARAHLALEEYEEAEPLLRECIAGYEKANKRGAAHGQLPRAEPFLKTLNEKRG